MAEDSSSVPSIPGNTNWSEWTYEQALAALTGEGADLHSATNAEWFTFNSSAGAGDSVSYHAFDEYYFGVNFNQDAIGQWGQAVDTIDAMMNDVARGKRGSMDLQTLRDLEMAIKMMAVFFDGTSNGLHSWSSALDSDDSAFKGKAAFLIQWRLKSNGDGWDDTHQQLTTRHGAPMADVVGAAGDALQTFNATMVNAWHGLPGLRNTIVDHLNFEVSEVMRHLNEKGIIQGGSYYVLDKLDTDPAKTYIKEVMAGYSLGDISTAAGWSAINRKVAQDVTQLLKQRLDPPAQAAMAALQPAYATATSSLIEIAAPPAETMPRPAPAANAGGDGAGRDGKGLPNPDGGADGKGLPDPNGGADGKSLPNPDGSADGMGLSGTGLPNPDGGADGKGLPDLNGGKGLLDSNGSGTGPPTPNGGAGAGFLDPSGGRAGLPNPNGGGGAGLLDPAGGGAGAAFIPGLGGPGGGSVNEPTGAGKVGPGADGAFNEPGGGNGLVLPDGDGGLNDSILNPGTGKSGTALPGGGTGLNLPGGAGKGDGGLTFPTTGTGVGSGTGTRPGGIKLPGGGAAAGAGLKFPGGGAGAGTGFGAHLGAGPHGGGPGGSGLGGGGLGTGFGSMPGGGTGMPSPAQVSGPAGLSGGPGGAGAGSGSADGAGGVPFFPPMMGGQGAGGDKPEERQRQTWLAEDEGVWGTSVNVGSGVIGRLEEEFFEEEELPLAGPLRGQRRTDTPWRPRPAEKEAEETSGTTATT
jgi:hypothetical protein